MSGGAKPAKRGAGSANAAPAAAASAEQKFFIAASSIGSSSSSGSSNSAAGDSGIRGTSASSSSSAFSGLGDLLSSLQVALVVSQREKSRKSTMIGVRGLRLTTLHHCVSIA